MNVCAVEVCNLPVRGRGWCRSHHARYLKHGTPGTTAIREKQKTHDGVCQITGCPEYPIAKRLCAKHHTKLMRHGDAEHDSSVPPMPQCAAPACDRTARYRASRLCHTHYQRLRNTGALELPSKRADVCQVQGCEGIPTTSYRYCNRHETERGRYGIAGERFYCDCGADMRRGSMRCPTCAYAIRLRRAKDGQHRRRAAINGATHEPIDSLKVYERDEWQCGLCQQPVDRDTAWPDVMSASLDHVVPLAIGGTHTYDNVQLAHLTCNTSKGHRSPPD